MTPSYVFNLGAVQQMLPNLSGHLVFGAPLGLTFARLKARGNQGTDVARDVPSLDAARR